MQNYPRPGGPGGYAPSSGYPPTGGQGYPPGGVGYPTGSAGYPPGGAGYPPGGTVYPPGGAGFAPGGVSGYPAPQGQGYPGVGGAGYPAPGGGYGVPPTGSYPQTGYPQPGVPQQGYPGMAPGGMPPGGMPYQGVPPGGMPPSGMPYQGQPQPGITPTGMPQQAVAMYGGPPIYNPPLPFLTQIQGGLMAGRSIVVTGMSNPGAERFHINFQEDPQGNNIALHFNPRIDCGTDSNTTVINTKSDDVWGLEDRGAPYFPFGANQTFELRFIIDQDRFRILVDNKPFWDYPHRIHPLQRFSFVNIDGDVTINNVCFQ